MENNYYQESMPEGKPSVIELGSNSLNSLDEVRRWAKFLSVVSFVYIGLALMLAIFFSISFSNVLPVETTFPFSGVVGLFYLIIAVIAFFPIWFLFKFSTYTKRALNALSKEDIDKAFYYLKNHYIYIGVLTLIFTAIYAIGFIAMLVAITAGA